MLRWKLSLQKPSTAVEYLAAHLSKIHGLDWHPDNEYTLATSSQDNSVRVGVVSGTCAWEMSKWWSSSLSAAAVVLGSACHWQDLDPYYLISGSLCALSQECIYRTGREVITGWVHICLPHICGGLGSTEDQNNRLCLLLAKWSWPHIPEEPSPQNTVLPASSRLQQLGGRHTPSPGVPKLVLNWVINKKLPVSIAMQGLYLRGNSVLCTSAK